jgi:hypothetical protein
MVSSIYDAMLLHGGKWTILLGFALTLLFYLLLPISAIVWALRYLRPKRKR